MGQYQNILLIIILLNYFSFIYNNNNNNIIIPLYYTDNNNNLNYLEFLLQPQLYAKIKLGSPEQLIYLLITTDSNYFSIESDNINLKFYNSNKSSTFINKNNKFSFYQERYKSGCYCTEQFYFLNDLNTKQEHIYKNITFTYINELSGEYMTKDKKNYIDNNNNELSGIIGLQYPKSFPDFNILKSLNNIGIINKNIWSIKYINLQPYLILGENLDINGYNDYDEIKRTNCYSSGFYNYWYFLFNDIKIGNVKLNEKRIAQYSPDIGVIVGVKEYQNFIQKNFFDDFIKNKKCYKNKINYDKKYYFYYECDVNINLDNFQQLEFIHQELSYKFILDKNDLFVDYNNKKYFLCIFEEEFGNNNQNKKNWIFGTPFVKKYNFIFDQDSKLIFFNDKGNEININSHFENSGNNTFTLIIIIFLIAFACLLFAYLIIKIIFRPKQIKANELEDSFSYKNQEDTNNKEILKSISISKYNKLGL